MLPTISPDHQHKIHYLPARSDITNLPSSHRPLPPIKARIQRGCAEVADESAPIPIRLAFGNGRDCGQFSGEQLFRPFGHLVGARTVNE